MTNLFLIGIIAFIGFAIFSAYKKLKAKKK